MNFHLDVFRRVAPVLFGIVQFLAILTPDQALAQSDPRSFPNTGYTIVDDAVWAFFTQYGGTSTFGEPISREFLLMGIPVQVFQNAALQVRSDGFVRVQPMQLTDPGLLPYTSLAGLTVPSASAATAFVAPTPDQSNYLARLQVFVQALVTEPFLSTYNATGGTVVWGLPTSGPTADPHNPNFIYQRFQTGILFYDAGAGTTQALPLGSYLKDVLTGQNLPADLASEAAGSALLKQYAATQPTALARPSVLTQTDLTDAFVPDAT